MVHVFVRDSLGIHAIYLRVCPSHLAETRVSQRKRGRQLLWHIARSGAYSDIVPNVPVLHLCSIPRSNGTRVQLDVPIASSGEEDWNRSHSCMKLGKKQTRNAQQTEINVILVCLRYIWNDVPLSLFVLLFSSFSCFCAISSNCARFAVAVPLSIGFGWDACGAQPIM